MEDKKIWKKKEVFKFITRYKYYRELWDTQSVVYKNKLKRTKALHSLASEFKTNVGEINRKIRVLRSQFFQMYKKMYEDCDENGVASPFVTKWEYYRPLQFISVSRMNTEVRTVHLEKDHQIREISYDDILNEDSDKNTTILLIVQKDTLHSSYNETSLQSFDFEEHKC